MKALFFYSSTANTALSNQIRQIVINTQIPFTELVLETSLRLHNTTIPGINVVIAADGVVIREGLPINPQDLINAWNVAPSNAPAIPPDVINPAITRAQATTILKSLQENPPTQGSPWTAVQQQQALYLMLMGEFRDFKTGFVY